MHPEVVVKVLLFAKARDLAGGVSELSLPFPSVLRDVEELKQVLFSSHPQLRPLQHCAVIAVNESYVESGAQLTLRPNDEIAFIPPISGG